MAILTSSTEERDLVDGYKLGVNSYMRKPVDFDQFREIVKQLGLYWLVANQSPPTTAFSKPVEEDTVTTPTNETVGRLQDYNDAPTRLRVLILEDNQRDAELFIRKLQEAGFELDADTVDTEEAFVASLRFRVYDLILSDYSIPEWSGLEAFRFVKRSGMNIPFVLVTGTLGEEAAVDLIKEGVADYILKDRLTRLPSAVRRALDEKLTRDEAGASKASPPR